MEIDNRTFSEKYADDGFYLICSDGLLLSTIRNKLMKTKLNPCVMNVWSMFGNRLARTVEDRFDSLSISFVSFDARRFQSFENFIEKLSPGIDIEKCIIVVKNFSSGTRGIVDDIANISIGAYVGNIPGNLKILCLSDLEDGFTNKWDDSYTDMFINYEFDRKTDSTAQVKYLDDDYTSDSNVNESYIVGNESTVEEMVDLIKDSIFGLYKEGEILNATMILIYDMDNGQYYIIDGEDMSWEDVMKGNARSIKKLMLTDFVNRDVIRWPFRTDFDNVDDILNDDVIFDFVEMCSKL